MKRSEERELQLSRFMEQKEAQYFSDGATSVSKEEFVAELSALFQEYTDAIYEKARAGAYIAGAGLLDKYVDFCEEVGDRTSGYFFRFLEEGANIEEEEQRRAALSNNKLS